MKPPGFRYSLYNALVTPRPIGWISTISGDGVVNLAPFSFFNMCGGDPPSVMYCANGTHREGGPKDSLANIAEVPEFVVQPAGMYDDARRHRQVHHRDRRAARSAA